MTRKIALYSKKTTRLLSGTGSGPLEFTQPHYCAVLREDAKLAAEVLNVTAVHKQGVSVRYSITGGNRDGLFTIDQHTGLITLAAALDYEVYDKHELVIAGDGGGSTAHAIVQVRVADVNDNPPHFIKENPQITVIEEDDRHLPTTLLQVEAQDKDDLDYQGLLYTVRGDGVDGYKPSEAYFTINSLTGELIQQRALDRDPPWGKAVWKVRVQVRDGQALWSRPRDKREGQVDRLSSPTSGISPAGGQTDQRSFWASYTAERRKERKSDVYADRWAPRSKRRRREREEKASKLGEDKQRRESFLEAGNISENLNAGHQSTSLNSFEYRVAAKATGIYSTDGNDVHKEMSNEKKSNSLQDPFPSGSFAFPGEDEKIILSNMLSEGENGLDHASNVLIDSDKNNLKVQGFPLNQTKKSLLQHHPSSKSGDGVWNDRFHHLASEERNAVSRKRISNSQHKDSQYIPGYTSVDERDFRLGGGPGKTVTGQRDASDLSNSPENGPLKYKPRSNFNFSNPIDAESQKVLTSHLSNRPRLKKSVSKSPFDFQFNFGSFGFEGDCDDEYPYGNKGKNVSTDPSDPWANTDLSAYGSGGRIGRVHVVETIVTLFVKDINDNPPVFPNATMFGEVQENGPIDLSVAHVSAWDADDANEGNNAKITYSIEKNVVHERTGEAIFSIHPKSGLVTTAVCCLDRETTPEYYIQVVATDGGGLKGTGTVIVRLADVNDNSPRLSKKMWEVEIDETWGVGPPDNSTILEISVNDRDTANYFFYRVVEESGWGWSHFDIRSVGTIGHLYARQALDYEDDTHRRGFKFMVQVTDRGRGGWVDPRHLDSAWVKVRLNDLNDNPPRFHRPNAHVTVREDATPGTLLATLPAHDPDMGGKQGVKYRVVGGWGALNVDESGAVSLWRSLDRETSDGAIGVAKVMAVDTGQPPLTSTASLTITVTDVNDCPPDLLPPTIFHVTEGAPPSMVGLLTATDHDVWALGHGPPFNLSMAPSNPSHVLAHIDIKFDPHLDSGRGGAEVWTKEAIDREQYRELNVGIILKDAGNLADTRYIKVIIDDVNDNPMKPAAKTVYLWKTQSGSSDAPLGRVYVNDPDDWDIGDKVFQWVGQPHPLFTLNTRDGTIFASSQVREGRYELQFAVSDNLWGQRAVSANVTVAVRLLTQDALGHSTPITLSPTTPEKLTAGWTPTRGGGGLGKLIQGVMDIVGPSAQSVEVVSIYEIRDDGTSAYMPMPFTSIGTSSEDASRSTSSSSSSSSSLPSSSSSSSAASPSSVIPQRSSSVKDNYPPIPTSCVWVSVKETGGAFMDPVKLHGILGLHSSKLERAANLTVLVERPTAVLKQLSAGEESRLEDSPLSLGTSFRTVMDPLDPSSAASRASTSLPLQVVDTNSTSLVTPRLTRTTHCSIQEPENCTPVSCLNGGRCVRTLNGNRCVCPSGAWGYQCKILSRSFTGSGFAWIRPLPSCLPTMISFRVLTRHHEGLLLYAGPLLFQPRGSRVPPTPLLVLQIVGGEVQMMVEGGTGPLKLKVGTAIDDGDWHVIHARLDTEGASLMVDLCGQGWDEDKREDDSHCISRMAWRHHMDAELWFSSAPIQLGGLAHTPPNPHDHRWRESPTSRPLNGCLSHLTINGQLIDLGEPALSRGSTARCSSQDTSCPSTSGGCGVRGSCVGGLNQPECECPPGWTGPECNTPTVPVSLRSKSYIKMALSFTPASRVISVQIRVRTRGRRSGIILHIEAKQSDFSLELQAGIVCASVTTSRKPTRIVCVEGRPVGDGMWHTIRAERHGHNLLLGVDDADGWRHNHSLPSLTYRRSEDGNDQEVDDDIKSTPTPMKIDRNEGVRVGGLPKLVGAKLITVYEDLQEACLDDLRISGRSLPLTQSLNGTTWGHVTRIEGIDQGCTAKNACPNITCASPLSCISNWGRPTCSCGQGRQLIGRTCEDVDECLWRPCLHSGSCYNMRPGFMCVCGPGYTGEHCQWNNHNNSLHPLAGPAAIAAITVSLLLLVVVGVIFSFRLRRHWISKTTGAPKGKSEEESITDGVSSEEATIIEVKGGTEEGGGKMKTEPTQELLLESLNLKLPQIQPAIQSKEKSSTLSRRPSKASLAAVAAILDERTHAGGESVMAKDDLRAYAYEGDGSSAGSLTSAISGLRIEQSEEGSIHPLVPAFLDVMDLLKNLPEASKSLGSAGLPASASNATTEEAADNPLRNSSSVMPISDRSPFKGKTPSIEPGTTPSASFKEIPPPPLQRKDRGGSEEISTIC